VKDLYTKAAGAFQFRGPRFLVLGNVYETSSGALEDETPAASLLRTRKQRRAAPGPQ